MNLAQETFKSYNNELFNSDLFDVNLVNGNLGGIWRYHHFLPVDYKDAVTIGEGFTPLLQIELFGKQVFVKQEQLFPTGSYKDRGASVLMSYAKKIGVTHVVQDSSGNAGCSIAAYAANAGIGCDIFVPADTSSAKLAQVQPAAPRLVSNRKPFRNESQF